MFAADSHLGSVFFASSAAAIGGTVAGALVVLGLGGLGLYWLLVVSRRRKRLASKLAYEAGGDVEVVAAAPVTPRDAHVGGPDASIPVAATAVAVGASASDITGAAGATRLDSAFSMTDIAVLESARLDPPPPTAATSAVVSRLTPPSVDLDFPDVITSSTAPRAGEAAVPPQQQHRHLQLQQRAQPDIAATLAPSVSMAPGSPPPAPATPLMRASRGPAAAPSARRQPQAVPPPPGIAPEAEPPVLYFRRRASLGSAGAAVAAGAAGTPPARSGARRHSIADLLSLPPASTGPGVASPAPRPAATSAWMAQPTEPHVEEACISVDGALAPDPPAAAVRGSAVPTGPGRRGVASLASTAELLVPRAATMVGARAPGWAGLDNDDDDADVSLQQPGFVVQPLSPSPWAARLLPPQPRSPLFPVGGGGVQNHHHLSPEPFRQQQGSAAGGDPAALAPASGAAAAAGTHRRRSMNDMSSAAAAVAASAGRADTMPVAVNTPSAGRPEPRVRSGPARRSSLSLVATALLAERQHE